MALGLAGACRALAAVVTLLVVARPAAAARTVPSSQAAPAIIAFGDSLTDTGNFFEATGGQVPEPDYYWKGRFTNAPGAWVDWLPKISRRVEVTNFAYGGATACDYSQHLPSDLSRIPSLASQIELFNQRWSSNTFFNKRLSSKTHLPTIWIGHNDILFMDLLPPDVVDALPNSTVDCILSGVASLLQAGHKQVVVGALAPIDLSPKVVLEGTDTTVLVRDLVSDINAALKAGAAALQKQFAGQDVLFWDVNHDTAPVVRKFRHFGFKHGNDASCVVWPGEGSAVLATKPTSVCSNPQDYVFYDEVHPSSHGHLAIADSFVRHLRRARIIGMHDTSSS